MSPTVRRTASPAHRILARLVAALLAAFVLTGAGSVVTAPAAHAASQGAGFGSWAPVSTYGWHGSMLVDGVHTYCILPGLPAPTGPSADQGVSAGAAGLNPQQLTAINHLVTVYGQSGDAVQSAAVGWAVKAIANWDETLHSFGYAGDSLAGAIHWTFSALAPEHDAEIQRLAVAYYDEARSIPAGVAAASGRLVFRADDADPATGSVLVEATTTAAVGTVTLVGATFAANGSPTLADVVPGVEYPIVTVPPTPGRPYAVSGSGRMRLTAVAAVRHFTTPGGQDTAGPAGEVGFDVAGSDAAPRVPRFAPTIATQVGSAYVTGGGFVDDVRFAGSLADWPRAEDGTPLPVTATAEVFRTDSAPVLSEHVPEGAQSVGSLALTTDAGPEADYRVSSLWELPEPGFYTAVWRIRAEDQTGEVRDALPPGYAWSEPFGEASQISLWSDVSSLAQATAVVGEPVSDKIIVRGPIPPGGLTVTSTVYLAADGVPPSEACVDAALVWTSDAHVMLEPGEHVVTSPAVSRAGTYYWQERAVDAAGALVHRGTCGVAHETTLVGTAPPPPSPRALAATGTPVPAGAVSGIGIALLTAGGTLLGLRRHGHRTGPRSR